MTGETRENKCKAAPPVQSKEMRQRRDELLDLIWGIQDERRLDLLYRFAKSIMGLR